MLLEKCSGPPCPRCGCQDVRILQEPPPEQSQGPATWWAAGRAVCNHCRTKFAFRERPPEELDPPDPLETVALPEPEPPATKCPKCGGRYHAYRTIGQVQYRKCKDCGHRGEKTVKKAA